MKLLISGLGGALFPYLHNILKDKHDLYYVDANKHLKYLYPDYNFFESPLVTDITYFRHIKDIILSNKIDYYIPLIDEELILAKSTIDGYNNTRVICPDKSFATLCLNKYLLMKKLEEEDISRVETFTGTDFQWQIGPGICKPIAGRGSRGIRKIDSLHQLTSYYSFENYLPHEIIIQPFLRGTEYTVGVLCNNKNQLICLSSKKIIQKKGITQIAVTENNYLINTVINKIVKKLKPSGPFNVQLFLTPANEIKIFEINPRFSTTSIMEFEGGVNLIDLYIQNQNQEYTGGIMYPKEGLVLHRRWENVFYNAE